MWANMVFLPRIPTCRVSGKQDEIKQKANEHLVLLHMIFKITVGKIRGKQAI